jgi:hypothetical protein
VRGAGCIGDAEFHKEEDPPWYKMCLPSWQDADDCAADLRRASPLSVAGTPAVQMHLLKSCHPNC